MRRARVVLRRRWRRWSSPSATVIAPPALVAIAAAGLLGLGGLGWMARQLIASASGAEGRPSLLEILQEVRQPPMAPEAGRRQAPPPPQRQAWRSPLRPSCAPPAEALRQRLENRLVVLQNTPHRVAIDPSNFGQRFDHDAFGNPVDSTPKVVVLHETVYGIGSALNTFLTPHPNDDDQVSYHTLIGGDGAVLNTVDPSLRAFGAGNSAFNGLWVITNPRVSGSVNNFALHLSLETPLDGEDNDPAHSGYSSAQYDAMAVVLTDWMRRFGFPAQNITTHRYVDLGGERGDPRSFDWRALEVRLAALGMLCPPR
ncbi:peptidoglycan recognition family protein [Synechococcus sp. CCY9202]|uniref:N-acetylmuramoyl-L-alanine amidase n=1 Tax=Synechococcus sp. CCY9202 TaxID=174698 RepID=UPI002B2016DB|nr:peptidoglycan recognition family protein [Synechococcus sp. CCY9202]MEA5424445.1 peptidoglycan recognition family protein [Synechococcus sp. CCY9202]